MSSLELEGPDFEKTVHDHARYLGLDPQRHPQLLWIAVEALTAKVPSDWRVAATKSGSAYFYNTRTRETMWEHPLDEKFKSMVREHLGRLGELTLDEEGRAVGGNGKASAGSQHLPTSLSRPNWRHSPADEKPPRRRRGNSDGGSSGDDSDSHSQESRDAIVELESRLMQEVAQNKILQDQLEHEQALNRQYQARSAEADVTILKLRGEVAEHKSSLVASQSGENNQAEQARVLQEHLHNEQQKALQLQENLSAASADVRYMQSTMSVYQTQVQSLTNRCADLEEQCREAREQAQKATNLESITAARNEMLVQKNADLSRLQHEMMEDFKNRLPGAHAEALAGASLSQRTDAARMELANQTLNAQQVALEGRSVQLQQKLQVAQNKLQEAQDQNAQLRRDLLDVKHDLRSRNFDLAQLQDQLRVDQVTADTKTATLSRSVSPSAADAAQQELTNIVNEAKHKRNDVSSPTPDRQLQLKYNRLKQQFRDLDDRHAKLEDLLRDATTEHKRVVAKLRRELDEERNSSRTLGAEEKRYLAKARVQIKQQQERLREEAADMRRAREDAENIINQANLLTAAQSSATDARLQARQTTAFEF